MDDTYSSRLDDFLQHGWWTCSIVNHQHEELSNHWYIHRVKEFISSLGTSMIFHGKAHGICMRWSVNSEWTQNRLEMERQTSSLIDLPYLPESWKLIDLSDLASPSLCCPDAQCKSQHPHSPGFQKQRNNFGGDFEWLFYWHQVWGNNFEDQPIFNIHPSWLIGWFVCANDSWIWWGNNFKKDHPTQPISSWYV